MVDAMMALRKRLLRDGQTLFFSLLTTSSDTNEMVRSFFEHSGGDFDKVYAIVFGNLQEDEHAAAAVWAAWFLKALVPMPFFQATSARLAEVLSKDLNTATAMVGFVAEYCPDELHRFAKVIAHDKAALEIVIEKAPPGKLSLIRQILADLKNEEDSRPHGNEY